MGAGRSRSERAQTFPRAHNDGWSRFIQSAGVRIATELEVIPRAAAIFVADVALAYVASQYHYFLWGMKCACFAITHDSLARAHEEGLRCKPRKAGNDEP
jgi:hypothetical protein